MNKLNVLVTTLLFITTILVVINGLELYYNYKPYTYIKENHSHRSNEEYIIKKIAKVLSRECENCYSIDKILIASSILNRMNNCSFPSSIDSIVNNQYCIADTFSSNSYYIAKLVVNNDVRDYNVLYFFNPKTATDIRFINSMKKHDLLVKTKYHEYYN